MNKLLAKYRSLPVQSRAALWFAVCSAIQSGASFLAIPFLTRLMSQDQYGIVTLYNSWRQIVIIFATLNIYCAVFNNGMVKWKEERDRYLASMIGLTLVLVIIVGAVYAVLQVPLTALFQLDSPFIWMMLVQIFATTVFSLWSARERFEYRYRKLVALTVVYAVVGQTASILCTWLTPDDSIRAFVSVASLTVVLLVMAIALAGYCFAKGRTAVDMRFWKHAVLFNLPLIPHYLATLVLGQADRIMISSINGASDAAIYGVAYTIGLMVQIVTSAVSNAIVPWLYAKLERRETEGVSALFEAIILAVGLLNVFIVFIAPEFMAIVGPSSYQAGVYVIPPVAASMLFTFVYGLFAYVEFFYEKRLGVVIASASAAIANVALNLWALPRFGFVAAAYTTLVCYGLLAVGHYTYARSLAVKAELGGLLNGKRILGCCLAFAPVGALGVVLYPLPAVRFALIAVVLVAACIKRAEIRAFVGNFKSEKKKGAQ